MKTYAGPELDKQASPEHLPREEPVPERQFAPPAGTAQPKPKKIGLFEHMGGGNLGDDATVAAVMQNLRLRWPDAEIYGFSMNTEDTTLRHGIPSYPIRRCSWSQTKGGSAEKAAVRGSLKTALVRVPHLLKMVKAIHTALIGAPRAVLQEAAFLGRSFRTLRSFDLLVISGGGQLTEAWGGPWSFPYTLFKWSLLARVCRVQCFYVNVGAGPLERRLSRFFVRRALRLADYVSFRDEDSRALVRLLGYTKSADVAPDCVYGLETPALEKSGESPRSGRIVGFSPMAYCDPRFYWDKNQAVYDRVRRNLVLFGSWLNREGYDLRLFSTDIWFDATVLDEVEAALKQAGTVPYPERIMRERVTQVPELLARIERMDYIVTCRYHGVIFAHMMGKPVLALSHHPKVATLMKSLGLSDYCVDLRECDAAVLQQKFSLLARNKDAIASRLAENLACYKTALARQFDGLFKKN
jgi:polysaccharide pyruvyl transferase WcaK-like protein